MKVRGARETGICNIREELYSECLTINCLQRGELLNHIKEQMKETINYYQKLYESAMAFAMRKVLREQKKRKRLELREITLENQIQNLNKQIEELEIVIQDKIKK
jgi:dynein light intermediate chain